MTGHRDLPRRADAAVAPKMVAHTERQLAAVRLRMEGCSSEEIGRRLGVSRVTAWRYIRDAMAQRRIEIAEEVDTLRALEVEKIEGHLRHLRDGIEAGDPKAHRAALGWHQRLAKLQGLDLQHDAPSGPEVIVVDARRPWERGAVIDGEIVDVSALGGGDGNAVE